MSICPLSVFALLCEAEAWLASRRGAAAAPGRPCRPQVANEQLEPPGTAPFIRARHLQGIAYRGEPPVKPRPTFSLPVTLARRADYRAF